MSTIKYVKYLRYSRAHGDTEPDSINNQEKIIDEFVSQKIKEGEDWILYEVYIDIDCSGANFNRPGFLKMKEDIQAGEIDVVLSKDISRFGRNIATEVYFSEIFPKYGTKFIGVTDGINSGDDGNILERQIRSVMNENYCRDISNKVKSSFYALMAEGKFIGSSEPYGFVRAPEDKHKLLVDEKVKPVILRIAKLYLQGNGFSSVAKILNNDKNPPFTPTEYKKIRGINYKNNKASKNLWSPSTIRNILTDPIYNGTLVQKKYQKINFKLKNKKRTNEEKVIRIDNAVEKIIDDETWKLIQKRIKSRSKTVDNSNKPKGINEKNCTNIYSGLLYCNDCSSKMVYRSDRDLYMCGTYAKYGKKYCTNHNIKTKKINEVILTQLNILNKLTINIERLISNIAKRNCNQQNHQSTKRKQLEDRLNNINKTLKVIREEYAAGEISAEDYRSTRQDYQKEKEDLDEKLLQTRADISQEKGKSLINLEQKSENYEKIYRDYFMITSLDRELVIKLVDQIIIGENETLIEIKFNTSSPFY
ncbi:recombinase family protein [Natranaerofaba carboxydovora]|uniref:recombinase family protein n=1 Tax=Natranaerofaba carboxydovora TaxID=2742683 RepID=UPI001F12B910|nr:recombinase family protein [Natranaerofaba carboxydovora]UMZ74863.1 Recombinase [Natranaerofaba carboxydovora]